MSTAGKVLSVLVTLALLGWIFLAALVSDLNANWGKEIAKLQQQVGELSTRVTEAETQISLIQNQATVELVRKDKDILSLRTHISKLEKSESALKETLSRYQLQNADVQSAQAREKARYDFRIEEQNTVKRLKGEGLTELAVLKSSTDQLFSRLEELRSALDSTLEKNRALMQQYLGRGTARASVRTAQYNR